MKNGVVIAVLSVSLLAAHSIAQNGGSVGPGPSQIAQPETGNTKHPIEYEIAGLRPGRDTLDKAYRRFHKDRVELSSPGLALWVDECNHQKLTVVFDTKDIIREVRIEPDFVSMADCLPRAYSRSRRARIGGTGRGLVFRDSCSRIQQIYGTPQSEGRTAHGEQEFVYRFDRGVKESSLTFELTCNAALTAVETIKLTSSARKP